MRPWNGQREKSWDVEMMGLRMRERNIARETVHLGIEAERMSESSPAGFSFSLSRKLGITLTHMF